LGEEEAAGSRTWGGTELGGAWGEIDEDRPCGTEKKRLGELPNGMDITEKMSRQRGGPKKKQESSRGQEGNLLNWNDKKEESGTCKEKVNKTSLKKKKN